MDNFYNSRDIRLAFGIPFDNLGFHELILAVKDLVESNHSHCILAVTSEYVLRTCKTPILCFDFCDLFIPCEAELLEMALKSGRSLTMPAHYEDFAEQIVKICAHNGHSLFNISRGPLSLERMENPEKLLIPEDLFTNFILEDSKLEKKDRTTILHSVSEHRPNVILICANFEILQDIAPEIMEHSRGSLVVCIPEQQNLSMLGYLRQKLEIKALLAAGKKAKATDLNQSTYHLPSSLRFIGNPEESRIVISGMIDKRMRASIERIGKKTLKRRTDLKVDMLAAVDISFDGLEALLALARKLEVSGKKIILADTNEVISQKFHEVGISAYFEGLLGIPEPKNKNEDEE